MVRHLRNLYQPQCDFFYPEMTAEFITSDEREGL
jgi:hypothetical protein